MRKQMTKIGTVPFAVLVPSTATEFNQLVAGAKHDKDGNIDTSTIKGVIDENAVLESAVDYVNAHITLGKVRAALVKELIKLGAIRKVIGKDAKDKDILEKADIAWIARAIKELGLTTAESQALHQRIADEVGFDVSGSREQKDFTTVDLKDAKSILEAIGLGNSSYERVKANLERLNPNLVVETDDDGVFTAEQLATALKVERARAEAARQQGLL